MSILVAVALALLTTATNVVVSFKIKFSPDAATAARDLKAIGVRVVLGAASLGAFALIVVTLYRTLNSTQPITRLAVFEIAFGTAAALHAITSWVLLGALGIMSRTLKGMRKDTQAVSETLLATAGQNVELAQRIRSLLPDKQKDAGEDPTK